MSKQRRAGGNSTGLGDLIQQGSGRVLVLSGRVGLPQHQSFPRKREAIPQTLGNVPQTDSIPAFAGMTAASNARVPQMRRVLRGGTRQLPAKGVGLAHVDVADR
jgi:hypothetical protein